MTVTASILQATGNNEQTYYQSLPREYYVSPEIFEKEYDKIFARQWILVGHESQIPARGDYFTIEIAGENIIITRTDEGVVHAMHNVCRHRGSAICDTEKGHVTSFVCPYHAWSYAPDGRLEGAPTIPADGYFDAGQFGLKAVRSASWRGFIFIHLGADEPVPLRESLGKVEAALPDIEPMSIKPAFEQFRTLNANWKLLAENNLECYHCDFNHDLLCSAANLDGFRVDLGQAVRYAVQDRNLICGNGDGIPMRPGAASLTASGELACTKLLNDGVGMGPGFSAGLHVAPVFGAIIFYPDYIALQTNLPTSANEVEFKVQWFVRADAVEGEDYHVEKLTEVFLRVADEDAEIVERNARGVASRSYAPGPLSKTAEPLNHVMLSMYLDWMSE